MNNFFFFSGCIALIVIGLWLVAVGYGVSAQLQLAFMAGLWFAWAVSTAWGWFRKGMDG